MPYPDNLLSRGEQVVLRKHPHWKVLVLPVVLFIVAIGGGSAFIAWVTHWKNSGFTSHTPWIIGIVVVAILILVWFVLVPVLRWATEHFVISTGHVFFRTGILKRREHQIPLARIQNMETEVGFWGRLLGYGSLIVDSAADQPLEFENVASLPRVQSTLNQLISDDRRRGAAGYGSPEPAAPAPTQQVPAALADTRVQGQPVDAGYDPDYDDQNYGPPAADQGYADQGQQTSPAATQAVDPGQQGDRRQAGSRRGLRRR